jgi:hypothetical protein
LNSEKQGSSTEMKKENEFPGLFRGIMLGHLILLLHVLLLGGVGILVIFFHGLLTYLPLILISGLVLASAGAYCLFRWMKARGRRLQDIMNSPALSGKSVEISLLGGFASIKLNSSGNDRTLPAIESDERAPLMVDKQQARIIELPELGRGIDPTGPVVHKRANRKLFKWKN